MACPAWPEAGLRRAESVPLLLLAMEFVLQIEGELDVGGDYSDANVGRLLDAEEHAAEDESSHDERDHDGGDEESPGADPLDCTRDAR